MRAFIMAAGRGTRLAPLTDVVPKPLIPIANEPAIVGLLRACARHGIRDVVINVSYLGDQLINAIGDGSSLGLRVTWSQEDEPLGTAGGMKNAEACLRDGDEPILVLSGDGLHDVDISAVAAAHRAAGVQATIVLSPVDDPQEYGVAVRDERGYITGFQEKPSRDEARSHDANTGIYLFAPEIFDRLPAAGEFYDFGSELFPALMHEREPVLGILHPGYWNDIGTHEELRRGTFAVVAGELESHRLSDNIGEPAQAGVLIHDTAEVHASAVLTAPCVVGPRARVGAGARIARSIVLPGGIVPPGALLAGATYGTVEGLAAWSASLGDTAGHDAPVRALSGDASS